MDKQEMKVRELKINDFTNNLLDYFKRYQKVTKVWRIEDNKKVIRDISFIENWDYNKKQNIILELKETLLNEGIVFGAFENDKLIGFASLSGTLIGENNEYIQLLQLQVSFDFRGRGIGKVLFHNCIKKARILCASKIYISGHSSVETQAFYAKMGCIDAKWLYKHQVELEPYDCQLEYIINH
ncbi:hypothetical protein SH1V18_19510 [Vallitalea longa]|uniref:N-acetyltransferase domain-containing protein n=1 Tax=Vallitalea longa TaxID=2936439 RepID=A0A9W5YBJ6_9FIRM|nr:GNAT family N-acetyltransferase [Vallitalea longa]GKX29471.1 hypothetical protein SH1V18_19510 [Vallitalea longa]